MAHVKNPGSHGATTWYYNKKGEVEYGIPEIGARRVANMNEVGQDVLRAAKDKHEAKQKEKQAKQQAKDETPKFVNPLSQNQSKKSELKVNDPSKSWNSVSLNHFKDPATRERAIALSQNTNPFDYKRVNPWNTSATLSQFASHAGVQISQVINSKLVRGQDLFDLNEYADIINQAVSGKKSESADARNKLAVTLWKSARILHKNMVPIPQVDYPTPEYSLSAVHGTDQYSMSAILRFGFMMKMNHPHDFGVGVYFKAANFDTQETRIPEALTNPTVSRFAENSAQQKRAQFAGDIQPGFVEVSIDPDKMLDIRNREHTLNPGGRGGLFGSDWMEFCRREGKSGIIGDIGKIGNRAMWAKEGTQICVYDPSALKISGWGNSISDEGKIITKSNLGQRINGALYEPYYGTIVMPLSTFAQSWPVREKKIAA